MDAPMTYRPEVPEDSGSDLMAAAVTVFEADRSGIERLFDAPWSIERRRRIGLLLEAWRQWLAELDPQRLQASEAVDATLLANLVAGQETQLKQQATRFDEMLAVFPSVGPLIEMLDARRRLEHEEPRATASRLFSIARDMNQTQRRLDEGCSEHNAPAPNPAVAVRLASLLTDVKKACAEWHEFRAGYDPMFTWWTSGPQAELLKALDSLSDTLRKRCAHADQADAIIGDPVGREALIADLEAALIPYSPEELIAIGQREMDWCMAEMLKASGDLGCGDDRHAALERVKEDHVPPGYQVNLIRDLAREAVKFIEDRDLMTIPPLARDGWRMEMMSAERQKVNPFFLGGESIIVSYPTDAMDHECKLMSMRGNNRHFARATVQHELIPGHFMQHFCQQRFRPYRRAFHTPFWIEGWTLYWELRLWELGFPRTPEERIGMLFWRMHRCARIVFSLRFHMGEMSPQECVDMLVNDVGHERATAEGEVRRSFGGDYPPLYQCAYMIGGLQMLALHREMVVGGRMTERAFHDAIMRENCMPVAVLRAVLRGDRVEPGEPPVWRFAD